MKSFVVYIQYPNYIVIIYAEKITMDNKDGQVDIVGKIVIDLNIDYPSECDSSESTNTILCIDLESDVMRHAINGDDNM